MENIDDISTFLVKLSKGESSTFKRLLADKAFKNLMDTTGGDILNNIVSMNSDAIAPNVQNEISLLLKRVDRNPTENILYLIDDFVTTNLNRVAVRLDKPRVDSLLDTIAHEKRETFTHEGTGLNLPVQLGNMLDGQYV